MDPRVVKLLLLARLVAYMGLIYVGFGLVVEWQSRNPDSKLRAFARLICSPLTAVMARFQPPETPYRTLLVRTALVIAAFWLALVITTEIVLPG